MDGWRQIGNQVETTSFAASGDAVGRGSRVRKTRVAAWSMEHKVLMYSYITPRSAGAAVARGEHGGLKWKEGAKEVKVR